MKYQSVIETMTLEQKCVLLSGGDAFGTRPFKSLGIPRLLFSDGPHGLRVQGGDANHLGIGGSKPATCFPTAATVANSWDIELGQKIGEALGEEALEQGVNVVLGPGLNIKRSPLCGRNFEYFSEDPVLSGHMAASYVKGIQSKGVSACPKHFAANSQETRRMASDSIIDERTLHEIYLAGFEYVVKNTHPQCIMSSYNLINGTYVNESKELLTDTLRTSWGFDGAVVTDWIATHDHAQAVAAGSTFEMPAPGLGSVRELIAAVKSGSISESDVDARVDEALELIFATQIKGDVRAFDREAHHQLARKVAAESAVLMKNDGVLPLAPQTRVAFIGDFAANPRYQGAGSSLVNSTKVDTLIKEVTNYDLNFIGYEQGFERDGSANESMAQAAVALAKSADVVVVCLGLNESKETEGMERQDMRLGSNQTDLLAKVAKVCDKVVVVLSAGSPVETNWNQHANAVLNMYLSGQAGACATLDLLTGIQNPCGKLNETWPHKLSDTPTAGNYPSYVPESFFKEGLFVGYRYYQTADVEVAYPFGFGLSYTSFEYSNLVVSSDENNNTRATVTVTNTGNRAGKEIVELYVSLPGGRVRPRRELKAFKKVLLQPSESCEVSFVLDDRAFSFYNAQTKSWEIEQGTYVLEVGASSEDIRLTAEVKQAGTGVQVQDDVAIAPAYLTGKVQSVSLQEFSQLYGKPLKRKAVKISSEMCFRDLNHGRSPVFWLIWLILTHLAKPKTNGIPNLNVHFIYNMPLHALTKSTGGAISKEMIDALVLELKGFWIIGFLLFVVRGVQNSIKNSQFQSKYLDEEK